MSCLNAYPKPSGQIGLHEDDALTSPTRPSKRQKTVHGGDVSTPRSNSYTVAWICALHIELAAAQAVLDEIHERLPTHPDDSNTYVLGSIRGHNVVIACLPTNGYGIVNAATVVTNMKRTFPAIRVGLMVGIGGGAPSKVDIRLGDIVVGTRVMQIDLGKIVGGEQLERTAIPRIPHPLLGTAVSALRAKHELGPSRIPSILQQNLEGTGYGRPSLPDRLFEKAYRHEILTPNCDQCDNSRLVPRSARISKDPIIHYGGIASGSQVIKNSVFRDEAAQQLDVICFEMEAAGLMDTLPCLPIRGICDYSDSHKSKEWQRYAAATAAAYARELLQELPLTKGQKPEVHTSITAHWTLQERRDRILNSLRFQKIDARKSTIRTAHAKTCEWFLSHPDYREWLNPEKLTQHCGFLWIKGKPGAGKSTIMKHAYSRMRKKDRRKIAVTASFFFNARGEYLEKSVVGMYRSLLLQLLEGYTDLQTVLDDTELYPTHIPNTCSSLNILKETLDKAIGLLDQRLFTCFIDALDECDEQQVRDMVQYFEGLAERSVAKRVAFRICFSSRHYPHVIVRLGTQLTLEDQSGHTEDLNVYIRSKLCAKDPEIVETLFLKSSGVFMWVVLVVDILNMEYARGAMSLKRRLEGIPADLSDLFRDMLRRDNNDMEALLLCFLWILCAERPLRPEEFYHALWSGLSPQGLADINIPDASARDTAEGLSRSQIYVISCSKGLAEVTQSDEPSVQFIHESVRDFLIKDNGLHELWPDLGLDWQSQSHEKLKDCCNHYIARSKIYGPDGKILLPLSPEVLDKYPFLEYANQKIFFHANAAAEVIPQENFLSWINLTQWIDTNNLFEKHRVRRYTPNASLLYILADKGYPNLIRTRITYDPEINIIGERYRYPLFAALARGDKASFAALLSRPSTILDGHDVTEGLGHRKDINGYQTRTPLSWAAERGRDGIVNLLLKSGIAVNDRDPDGSTPLLRAVENGHNAILRLLIDRGADVKIADNLGNTPLMIASRKGFDSAARILMEWGAEVNAMNLNGLTPLHEASGYGNKPSPYRPWSPDQSPHGPNG